MIRCTQEIASLGLSLSHVRRDETSKLSDKTYYLGVLGSIFLTTFMSGAFLVRKC